MFFDFLVAEQLNIWPCLSVPVPNFLPNFSYIVKEVLEIDELNEGNISAAAGK